VKNPTSHPNQSNKTPTKQPVPAGNGIQPTTLLFFGVALVILAVVCIYLMTEDPTAIRHIPATSQPTEQFMPAPDGQSPDAYGRPPGDPHYGHAHD